MSATPSRIAQVLEAACDAAAAETLPRFRVQSAVTNKLEAGFDPVTEADRGAERAIRAVIEAAFPDHAIEGEEYGTVRETARYRWIIDPIDGTRAFISGLPVWGTLIGLYEDGVPIAGVMDQPFTGERCMALPGEKTRFKNRFQPWADVQTSLVATLADATLMTSMPELLEGPDDCHWIALKDTVRLVRYSCDCYAFMMLACGHVEIVIETGVQSYDVAGLIPLVRQAGGCFTSWDGGDPARGGQVVATANPALHEAALQLLKR